MRPLPLILFAVTLLPFMAARAADPAPQTPQTPQLSQAESVRKIQELGPLLFEPYDAGQEAREAFSLITHEDAVIWLRALLNTSDPTLKVYALDQLARYNTDEAFNAITSALYTGPNNVTRSPHSSADAAFPLIRCAACRALSRSPHPRALAALQNTSVAETNPVVKTQVATLLADHDTPESRQTLATLAKDENILVSQEAKFSLDVLNARANKTSIPIHPPAPPSNKQPRHETIDLLILPGSSPQFEYLFVISQRTALKTVNDLKTYTYSLPPGSSLTWAPGCRRTGSEPLLSDEKALQDFKNHCKSQQITLIILPAG